MDNLSEEVTTGLAGLAGLDDGQFKAVLDHSLQSITHPSSSPSVVKGIAGSAGAAALSTLLVEAAKLNLDPQAVEGVLTEHQVAQGRAAAIGQGYKDHKGTLRQQLASTTFHPPALVDVDWRLDYFLKANSVEKINTPLFRVVLSTRLQDGSVQPIEVACTQEQLQDWVAKLKDATKQLERSAGRA